MNKQIDFNSEYAEFSSRAVEDCVRNGAVVLKGIISDSSVTTLKDSGYSTSLDVFCDEIPEVKEVCTTLGRWVGQAVTGSVCDRTVIDQDIENFVSHVDDAIPELNTVMTLLLPVTGPTALFLADNQPFNSKTSEKIGFVGHYGPGDGILLRQYVTRYNGNYVCLPMASHVGIANSPRQLIFVDLVTQGNVLANGSTDLKTIQQDQFVESMA